MAATSIHSITSTEAKALTYIANPEKTDNGRLVLSFGCNNDPALAAQRFAMIRAWGTGRNEVLSQHVTQSFKPGEISPEEALKVGKELADRLLKGEYQYMLAVHTDTDHIHCHLIFNNTNMMNGKTFETLENKGHKRSWKTVRELSDQICLEHGLSVIENPDRHKGKSHYEWDVNRQGLSWKAQLKLAIDEAVLSAENFEVFLERLRAKNIEIVYAPDKVIDLKFRMQGQERFIRARTLGWYYESEQIRRRIAFYRNYQIKRTKIIDTTDFDNSYWADLRNVKEAAKALNIFAKYGISNTEQLENYCIMQYARQGKLTSELNVLQRDISELDMKISLIRSYQKYKAVHDDYLAIAGVNAKKKFAKEHAVELEKYAQTKAQLRQLFSGSTLPNPDTLARERDRLIAERNDKNSAYKETKDTIKELDYCRQTLDDYMKNERAVHKAKKKNDLE